MERLFGFADARFTRRTPVEEKHELRPRQIVPIPAGRFPASLLHSRSLNGGEGRQHAPASGCGQAAKDDADFAGSPGSGVVITTIRFLHGWHNFLGGV